MDIKVYIYLVIAIGYYIFKFIKKQQEKQKQQAPANIPTVATEQNSKTIPPQVPQKSTLDDLFREFTENTDNYEKQEEYIPYNKTEVYKTYETKETQSTYEIPEVAHRQSEIPASKEYHSIEIEKKINQSRFNSFSVKNKNSNPIAEKLKNKTELKRAFIYSEIFKPKF